MFTVCPKCALTLVVTAADLRVAQGYVRCGRCLNVFNALARLSEDRAAASPAQQPDTGAAEAAQHADSSPSPAPSSTADETGEIEFELDASALSVTATEAAVPEGIAEPQAQAAELEPQRAEPDARPPAPAVEAPIGAQAPEKSSSVHAPDQQTAPPPDAPAPVPIDTAPSSRAGAAEAPRTNTPQPPPEGAFELEMRRPRASLAWRLGAGALTIALALQIVNHYRDALAASTALRGPLTSVYSALGVRIAPRWNIHAYEVRQLGASVAGAAAGEIVVRASVKNSGGRAQP
ncbi:MAG TPA: DUF3426 domain-containing protein, partial [Steroidobacteraceae bacterium]|nr:DUF3426 domain-containing protein [Steroidobacteraceae bacterium]